MAACFPVRDREFAASLSIRGLRAWIWVSLQPCDRVTCPPRASPFTSSQARPQRAPHVKRALLHSHNTQCRSQSPEQQRMIKAFLPGKKAEGDIKPDQRLPGMGETGLPLHGDANEDPQLLQTPGEAARGLDLPSSLQTHTSDVGAGGGRTQPVSPTRIPSAESAFQMLRDGAGATGVPSSLSPDMHPAPVGCSPHSPTGVSYNPGQVLSVSCSDPAGAPVSPGTRLVRGCRGTPHSDFPNPSIPLLRHAQVS